MWAPALLFRRNMKKTRLKISVNFLQCKALGSLKVPRRDSVSRCDTKNLRPNVEKLMDYELHTNSAWSSLQRSSETIFNEYPREISHALQTLVEIFRPNV